MTTVYFLIISVLFNGTPINAEYELEFDTLSQCQYAGAIFVQRVISPGWEVTAECVLQEVAYA
jgi:hypothetical protein